MKEFYRDLLFEHHILVCDEEKTTTLTYCFSIAMTLASTFGIRIRSGIEKLTLKMVEDAARNIGEYVPEPFYRNFPESVRSMTVDQLFYDQMLHYTQTYGLGWWDDLGKSGFEKDDEIFVRAAFQENTTPKDFKVLEEKEAEKEVKDILKTLLSSSRPTNVMQFNRILEGWKDFGMDILPSKVPCKDTVVKLLYSTKNMAFCRYLKLSDTIKLLEYIQYSQYGSENLKKLNLKNQDRKLIKNVIDTIVHLEEQENKDLTYCDYTHCFEKRKIWCGLFHHIHYKSESIAMQRFINDIRNNKNFSAYHYMEGFIKKGETKAAAGVLVNLKGRSDLVRHMNYILSRCETEEEIEGVFSWLG